MGIKYDEELLRRLYLEEHKSAEDISLELNLPLRGVRTKLSLMGIYIKKGYVSKTGKPPLKKWALVEEIGGYISTPIDQLESLEKVNKAILIKILSKLKGI